MRSAVLSHVVFVDKEKEKVIVVFADAFDVYYNSTSTDIIQRYVNMTELYWDQEPLVASLRKFVTATL